MSKKPIKLKKRIRLSEGLAIDDGKTAAAKSNISRNATTGGRADNEVIKVAVVDLKPREGNTKVFSESNIEELADDIKLIGMKQPILVKDLSDGTYEIIAGHRRWRAHQKLLDEGLIEFATMTAVVEDRAANSLAERRAWLTTNTKMRTKYSTEEWLNLIKNAEDLVEEERTAGILKAGVKSRPAVASILGISERSVTNFKQLDRLIPAYKRQLDEGAITLRSALELAALSENEQQAILNKASEVRAEDKVSTEEMKAIAKSAGIKKVRPKKSIAQLAKKLHKDADLLEKLIATSEQKDIEKAKESISATKDTLDGILGGME